MLDTLPAGLDDAGTMKHRSHRSVAGVAAGAFVLWAVVIAMVAGAKFGGDPRGLLFLGTRFYHPPAFAGIPRVGRFGYDGQFYAALAIDPWLRSPETVKALDAPAYRATRILVPMAAWLVTLGRPQAAIVAYQGLCWALSILAVAVAAAWLRREGGSPWWALLLACNAGLVTAMLRTTLDGAAVFFVVAALWLARQRQHGGAVPMAAAGNLCREISCIVPLAQAVHEGTARRWKRALAYAVLPLLPVLAWQAYMRAVWHPNLRLPSSVGTPAMALVGKVVTVLGGRGLMLSQEFWATLAACLTVAAGIVVAARRGRCDPPRLVFIAIAALAVVLAPRAYADAYGFSRHLIVAPFLAVPLAAGEANRAVRALLLAGPVAFSIAGLVMIVSELRPFLAAG